jgi:lipoate-protein ligase A
MSRTEGWRLLDTGPARGPRTAALDEAIAHARAAGEVPNTLHFYQRMPPAVTIGYSLDAGAEVDLDFCARQGIDVVRRLSGGGAIYTDDRQLVYSLTTRDVLPSPVEESLKVVCTALAKAISSLGVDAVFSPVNDVLVHERKVSGSAQMRKWGVVLQHGTVLVDADSEIMFRALRVPPEKRMKHLTGDPRLRVTTLKEQLGRLPSMDEVKSAVRRSFEEAFGVSIIPGRITDREEETARQLVRDRYGNDEWNLRRRKPDEGFRV